METINYIGLDVHNKRTISYCGVCGAEKSSGNTVQRTSGELMVSRVPGQVPYVGRT
jgi:hypothetical protein